MVSSDDGKKSENNTNIASYDAMKGVQMDIKVIISDLLNLYRTDYEDTGWAKLIKKSRISRKTLERYVNKEQSPRPNSARSLLAALNISSEKIREVMKECYGIDYLQKDPSDPLNFQTVARSKDHMRIWILASSSDGTSEEKIKNFIAPIKVRKLLDNMLNMGIIREINGRIKAKEFTMACPETQLEAASTIAIIAQEDFSDQVTKAINQVWSCNLNGLAEVVRDIDNFASKIVSHRENVKFKGPVPLSLGLAFSAIKRNH